MKKVLCFLISFALIAGCLCGCAGNKTTNNEEGKITISIAGWPSKQNPEELERMTKIRENFMAQYPDIIIEPDEWNFSTETFLPKAAGGQLPTLFGAHFTEVERMVSSGYAADITDLMDKYGYTENLKDDILSLISKDGKIYGIPSFSYVMGLFANKKLFEQAGELDESGQPKFPETFEELGELAQRITEKTGIPGFTLGTMKSTGGWHFMNIAWAYGGEFMKQQDDGKWKAVFNDEGCVKALEFVKDLKWKYKAVGDNNLIDTNELRKLFATNQTAMYFAAPTDSDLSRLATVYNMDKDMLSVGLIPAGPEGKFSVMGGWVYFLRNDVTEEEADAVFKWLDFIGENSSTTDESKKNLEEAYKVKVAENQVIGIKPYDIWKSGDLLEYDDQLRAKYANCDPENFKFYNEFKDVTIKPEEPLYCQQLYQILDDIIQQVYSDENADCQALLDEGVKNFQTNYLDRM